MRTVSIVMTYHNRPDQLRQTLRSFQVLYGRDVPDVQVVIVDDASSPSLRAQTVLQEMNFSATLIEISPEQKTWINPSVPFNRGFAAAVGEIILIQNAESLHMENVLDTVRARVVDDNYLPFPCYSTTQEQLHQIIKLQVIPDQNWLSRVQAVLAPFQDSEWYHHPTHNPTWYHFASAITRENLNRIGGFNEKFANGYCFEDNEFLLRIRHAGLRIPPTTPGIGYVAHLWHPKNPALHGGCDLWERNRLLYLGIKERLA